MSFLVPWLLAFAAALATEIALVYGVAGPDRRRTAVLACLWANLALGLALVANTASAFVMVGLL